MSRSVRRAALGLVLVLGASLIGGWTYNNNDYRKGEVAHTWPVHGAWGVALVSGGGEGTGHCLLATEAGAQQPTFLLYFVDDGQMLSVMWGDTNFQGANTQDQFAPTHETTLKVGDWVIFTVPGPSVISQLNGLKFAVNQDPILAWEDDYPGSDPADALDTDQVLNRIARGHALSFRDGPTYQRSIPLTGFAAAVKDLHACVYALGGPS